MIVLDRGDTWQVVLQPEHAELSEEVALAWADRGPRHDSVVLAARRHDDGWATWERSPLVDADGKPVSFLDVHVPAHLAFYRSGIQSVTDEDPYAGLLVLTAFCGASVLWITAFDMRSRGTSGRMRPIRGFDFAVGLGLLLPSLYALRLVWLSL